MLVPERKYMLAAIEQAKDAREGGDYAIGAVVVGEKGSIVSYGANGVRRLNDATCHAEMIAIRGASNVFENRHLEDCILYSTHEPCGMCTTASGLAKLKGIVYGAEMKDMKDYAIKHSTGKMIWRTQGITSREIAERGNPKIEIVGPFMRDECLKLFHSE